jgi:hypothetical protein
MNSYGRFEKDKYIDERTINGCYEIIMNSLEYKLDGMILCVFGCHETELGWMEHITKYMKEEHMTNILDKALTYKTFEYWSHTDWNCKATCNVFDTFLDKFAEYISEEKFLYYSDISEKKNNK